MAETVTVTLYGEKDGVTYQGQSITTSVEELALDKIASYETAGNTTACTALVDMLNYGAAVQVRHSHNADIIPSAGIYAAYATTTTPAFTATNSIIGSGAVKVYVNSVSMQAKVEIQLMFKTSDMEGRTFAAKVNDQNADVEYTAYGDYTICRVAVGASQMRDTFTIALCNANDSLASKAYKVSVAAYAQEQLGTDNNDVVIAMMRYGDSIAAL